jgi:hypothetical protein
MLAHEISQKKKVIVGGDLLSSSNDKLNWAARWLEARQQEHTILTGPSEREEALSNIFHQLSQRR